MSATGISLMHAGPNRGGSQARIDHGACCAMRDDGCDARQQQFHHMHPRISASVKLSSFSINPADQSRMHSVRSILQPPRGRTADLCSLERYLESYKKIVESVLSPHVHTFVWWDT
jgi:hypothetical protein